MFPFSRKSSASSSHRKKSDTSSSSRKRPESVASASASSSRKNAMRKDERNDDDAGIGTSAYRPSYTTADGSSGPSSYVTAADSRLNDGYDYVSAGRPQSLTASAIRSLTGQDDDWEDLDARSDRRSRVSSGDGKKKHRRHHRSGSESREPGSSTRRTKREKESRDAGSNGARKRATGDSAIPDSSVDAGPAETSRGYDDFNAHIGQANFSQFPGQYQQPHVGPQAAQQPQFYPGLSSYVPDQFPDQSSAQHPGPSPQMPPGMSSHVPDQFPGQNPSQYAAPAFGPSAQTAAGVGYGLASSYYNDQGQSVASQPGVRPESAAVVTGAQPPFVPASAAPNPSYEPSQGAAAEFFNSSQNSAPPQPPRPFKPTVSSSGKPSKISQSSSGNGSAKPPKNSKPSKTSAAATAASAAAVGYAVANSSSHQSSQSYGQATGNASPYQPGGNPSAYGIQPQHYNSTSEPVLLSSGPNNFPGPSDHPLYQGKQSSSANGSLYAAGAAGLAAGAYVSHEYAHHQQHHNNSTPFNGSGGRPPSYSGNPSSSNHANGNMSMQHKHKGPISRFVDWWKDYEDVRKMEEYTEYIGVCRYCFDRRSTPSEAPRKHHYSRRRSSESLGRRSSESLRRTNGSQSSRYGRIDKESRYYSSDNERRKNKSSWLGAGLAGYGLAKLWESNRDFDDTYSVKSGQRISSSRLGRRSRSSSAERRSRHERGDRVYVNKKDGVTVQGQSVSHSFRSGSRTRKSQDSPTQAAFMRQHDSDYVRSSRRSSAERREPSRSASHSPGLGEIFGFKKPSRERDYQSSSKKDRMHRKKKKGFFNFSNSSHASTSSSSVNSDLAFGASSIVRQQPRKQKKLKKNSDEHLNATLLGIAATGAALAAAKRGSKSSRHKPEVIAVRKRKDRHGHKSRSTVNRYSNTEEDDAWESASEYESSGSVSSGLAFGDFGITGKRLASRSSYESLTSQSSGTSKWGWRWGNSKSKAKRKPTSHFSHSLEGISAIPSKAAAPQPPTPGSYSRDDAVMSTISSTSSMQPMRYVHPIPTSDPTAFDVERHSPMPGAFPDASPSMINGADSAPLQQPQPVAPVHPSVYYPETPSQPYYPASSVPPVFQPPGIRRTQSSPVTSHFARDVAIAGALATTAGILSNGKGRGRDDSTGSAGVRFELTEKQARKEEQGQRREQEKHEEERRRNDRGRAVKDEASRHAAESERREREDMERRASEEAASREAANREEEALRRESVRLQQERMEGLHRQAQHSSSEAAMKRRLERRGHSLDEEPVRRYEQQEPALEPQQPMPEVYSPARDPAHQFPSYEPWSGPPSDSRKRQISSQDPVTGSPSNAWDAPIASAIMGAVAGAEFAPNGRPAYQDKGKRPVYDVPEIVPSGEYGDQSIRDDDLYDPDRFKRGRSTSPSSLAKETEFARRAAERVVADLENRYKQPSPSQAVFFAPKELSEPSKGKTAVVDPIGGNDVHVYRVPGISLDHPPNEPPPPYQASPSFPLRGDGKTDRKPWGIPRLNVIAPTPPVSQASSIKSDRSPLISPVDPGEPSADDIPNDRVEAGAERRRSNRVSWGQDQTLTYEVHTPDSAQDQFISSDELGNHQNPTTAGDGSQNGPSNTTASQLADAHAEGSARNIPEDDVVEEVDRDDGPIFVEPAGIYRKPFFENLSDIGFGFDSPGTEGAPPVQGFVEGEVDEPTPVEENSPHVLRSFEDDDVDVSGNNQPETMSTSSKKKKKDKAGKRASTDDYFSVVSTEPSMAEPETPSEFQVPLSKKEKKKREKEAKRASMDSAFYAAPSEAQAAEVEPEAEVEASLSKKEKKKREKSGKRSSVIEEPSTPVSDVPEYGSQRTTETSFGATEGKKTLPEARGPSLLDFQVLPSPIDTGDTIAPSSPQREDDDGDLFLSNKERKKREKAAKRALAEAESVPSTPGSEEVNQGGHEWATQAREVESEREPELYLSKKERKKREKLAQQALWQDEAISSPPAEELPLSNKQDLADKPAGQSTSWADMVDNRDNDTFPTTAKEKDKDENGSKTMGFGDVVAAALAGGAATSLAQALYRSTETTDAPEPKPALAVDTGDKLETSHEIPSTSTPYERRASFPNPAVEGFEDFADVMRPRRKSKRASAFYNSPSASSPLRSELVWDDYMGDTASAPAAREVPVEEENMRPSSSNGHPLPAPMTEQSPSDDRDASHSTDLPSPESGRDSRSVVSAVEPDTAGKRHKSRRSRREDDDNESPRRSPSVAASEPVDVYQSSTKHNRRSKHGSGDFDDAMSVTSARSSRSRRDEADDDAASTKSKKDKKSGGILSLFRRKSNDNAQKMQEPEEEEKVSERKHKRHHRRKSSERDPYDDRMSSASRSRHRDENGLDDSGSQHSSTSRHRHKHRSESEPADDYDDAVSQGSESRHRRKSHRSDEGREASRSRQAEDDFDDTLSQVSESRRRRKHRSKDGESDVADSRSLDRSSRNGDDLYYKERGDQSFLGARVEAEELPPLPASPENSPTDPAPPSADTLESSILNDTPGATVPKDTINQLQPYQYQDNIAKEESSTALEYPAQTQQEPADMAAELVPLPASEPSSPTQEVNSTANLSYAPGSDPPSPTRSLHTPKRPLIPLKVNSSTAVPLRFRKPPASPNDPHSRSQSLSSTPASEVASPSPSATPVARQARPHSNEFRFSTEFRPLYLVEANRKPALPQGDEEPTADLPSLPSSRTTSRASSFQGSNSEAYESAVEEIAPSEQEHEGEDVFGSQQTTPRASGFPAGVLDSHAGAVGSAMDSVRTSIKAEPEFWTWSDVEREEQVLRNKEAEDPGDADMGVGEPVAGSEMQSAEMEGDRSVVEQPPSLVESIEDTANLAAGSAQSDPSDFASATPADTAIDTAIGESDAIPLNEDPMATDIWGDDGDHDRDHNRDIEPFPSADNNTDLAPVDQPAEQISSPSAALSRNNSAKKGKKGKKGKAAKLGTAASSGSATPPEVSPQEMSNRRRRDTEIAVDSWFTPEHAVTGHVANAGTEEELERARDMPLPETPVAVAEEIKENPAVTEDSTDYFPQANVISPQPELVDPVRDDGSDAPDVALVPLSETPMASDPADNADMQPSAPSISDLSAANLLLARKSSKKGKKKRKNASIDNSPKELSDEPTTSPASEAAPIDKQETPLIALEDSTASEAVVEPTPTSPVVDAVAQAEQQLAEEIPEPEPLVLAKKGKKGKKSRSNKGAFVFFPDTLMADPADQPPADQPPASAAEQSSVDDSLNSSAEVQHEVRAEDVALPESSDQNLDLPTHESDEHEREINAEDIALPESSDHGLQPQTNEPARHERELNAEDIALPETSDQDLEDPQPQLVDDVKEAHTARLDVADPVEWSLPTLEEPTRDVVELPSVDDGAFSVKKGRKGKKGKKRASAQEPLDMLEPVGQPEPEPEPESEQSIHHVEEVVAAETIPLPPEELEEQEVPQILPEEAPEVAETKPVSPTETAAADDSPQVLTNKGKKGKKGKRGSLAFSAPEEYATPEVNTIVAPAAHEILGDAAVTEEESAEEPLRQPDREADAVIREPVEAAAEDEWADAPVKKGKKGKKAKRRSTGLFTPEEKPLPAQEAPSPLQSPATELRGNEREREPAPGLAEEGKSKVFEPIEAVAEDEWADASTKKGKKGKKGKRASAGVFIPEEYADVEGVSSSIPETPIEALPSQYQEMPLESNIEAATMSMGPIDAVAEDEWADAPVKKGKKGKKARKALAWSDAAGEPRSTEDEAHSPAPEKPEDVPLPADEQPVSESQGSQIPEDVPLPDDEQPAFKSEGNQEPENIPQPSDEDLTLIGQDVQDAASVPLPTDEQPFQSQGVESLTTSVSPDDVVNSEVIEDVPPAQEPLVSEDIPDPTDNHLAQAADDLWLVPYTKGKKDKKAAANTDTSQETSQDSQIGDLPADVVDVGEPVIEQAPDEEAQIMHPAAQTLNDLPLPEEQTAADDWATPVSAKPKKGKKNKKGILGMLSAAIETLGPATPDAVPVGEEPLYTVSGVMTPITQEMPQPIEGAGANAAREVDPEDEWALSTTKKSKKGKKAKRQSSTPTTESTTLQKSEAVGAETPVAEPRTEDKDYPSSRQPPEDVIAHDELRADISAKEPITEPAEHTPEDMLSSGLEQLQHSSTITPSEDVFATPMVQHQIPIETPANEDFSTPLAIPIEPGYFDYDIRGPADAGVTAYDDERESNGFFPTADTQPAEEERVSTPTGLDLETPSREHVPLLDDTLESHDMLPKAADTDEQVHQASVVDGLDSQDVLEVVPAMPFDKVEPVVADERTIVPESVAVSSTENLQSTTPLDSHDEPSELSTQEPASVTIEASARESPEDITQGPEPANVNLLSIESPLKEDAWAFPIKLSKKDKKKAKKNKALEQLSPSDEQSSPATPIESGVMAPEEDIHEKPQVEDRAIEEQIQESEPTAPVKLSKAEKKKAKKAKAREVNLPSEEQDSSFLQVASQVLLPETPAATEEQELAEPPMENATVPLTSDLLFPEALDASSKKDFKEPESMVATKLSKKDKKKARQSKAWEVPRLLDEQPSTSLQVAREVPLPDTPAETFTGEPDSWPVDHQPSPSVNYAIEIPLPETPAAFAEEKLLEPELPALIKLSKKDKKKAKRAAAGQDLSWAEEMEAQEVPSNEPPPALEAVAESEVERAIEAPVAEQVSADVAHEKPPALNELLELPQNLDGEAIMHAEQKKRKAELLLEEAVETPLPSEDMEHVNQLSEMQNDPAAPEKFATLVSEEKPPFSRKQSKIEKRKAKKGKILELDEPELPLPASKTETELESGVEDASQLPTSTQDTVYPTAVETETTHLLEPSNESHLPEPKSVDLSEEDQRRSAHLEPETAANSRGGLMQAEPMISDVAPHDPALPSSSNPAGTEIKDRGETIEATDLTAPNPNEAPHLVPMTEHEYLSEPRTPVVDAGAPLGGETDLKIAAHAPAVPDEALAGSTEIQQADQDLDFAAVLAAGLSETGFDPNLVVDDPGFHRRASPPGIAEPDPEEVSFSAKKGKKGKKGKQKQVASVEKDAAAEVDSTEPHKPESIPGERTTANDDFFSAALAAGLTASGFASNVLQDRSLDEGNVPNEPEPFSFAVSKKKKGKKGKKSTSLTPVVNERLAEQEMETPPPFTDSNESVPQAELDNVPALEEQKADAGFEINKTEDTAITESASQAVSAMEDTALANFEPATVDDWALPVKKNRKKGKGKFIAQQTAYDGSKEEPGISTISIPETENPQEFQLAERSIDPQLSTSMATQPEAQLPTSKVASLFPGLERVKRRAPHAATYEAIEQKVVEEEHEHPEDTHTEVSQSLPTPIDMTPAVAIESGDVTPIDSDVVPRELSRDPVVGDSQHEAQKQAAGTDSTWSFDTLQQDDWSRSIAKDDQGIYIGHDTNKHPGPGDSQEDSYSTQQESSDDPLRISIELNPGQSTPVPTEKIKGKDKSVREISQRKVSPDQYISPSHVDSTTKERTSHLFQSTPEALRAAAERGSPASQPIQEASESSQTPTWVYSVADSLSLEEDPTPPKAEDETSVYVPMESPVRKKGRAVSDVGSPEQGVKAARREETSLQEIQSRYGSAGPDDGSTHGSVHGAPTSPRNFSPRSFWSHLDDDSSDRNLKTRQALSDLRSASGMSDRSASSVGLAVKTPEQYRSMSATSNHSNAASLRRVNRSVSADLREASKRAGTPVIAPPTIAPQCPPTPPLQEDDEDNVFNVAGNAHAMDAGNVYEGWGDVHGSSSMSPTRPPSVRKRQSMHIINLEARLDQLEAENRQLQEDKINEEHSTGAASFQVESDQAVKEELAARELQLREKDDEIRQLRAMLEALQQEVARLGDVNGSLTEANKNLIDDTNNRYATLQHESAQARQQLEQTTHELEALKQQHSHLSEGMEEIVRQEIASSLADKNLEIQKLHDDLTQATEKIRSLHNQILLSRKDDYLVVRDEDYFDTACQKLCQHVQQWVLRFSKYSDTRPCRLTSDLADDKIEARLDNAILDGTDVDKLLASRVRRRDIFMSVVMSMIWEYVFTRYLFGMDREQRQKLKALEKILTEVGPPRAVAHWRATTLTLLSRRPAFATQRNLDSEAVAQEIFSVLSALLPPPNNLQDQILSSLRNVMRLAVDLSIEMRTQRAEYIMLPPLQPEWDEHGNLVRKVHFNAALMNERSGEYSSNDELQRSMAVVKIVLFPLVVKKGNDSGEGEDEIVVCPAQVLVSNPDRKKVVRVLSGAMEIDEPRRSRQSLLSAMDSNVF